MGVHLKVFILITIICIGICSCRRPRTRSRPRPFKLVTGQAKYLGFVNTRTRGRGRPQIPVVCRNLKYDNGPCVTVSLGSAEEAASVCAYCQSLGYQFCMNLFCQ